MAALLDGLGLRDRRFLLGKVGEMVNFLVVQPFSLRLLDLNQRLFRVAQRDRSILGHERIVVRSLHRFLRP